MNQLEVHTNRVPLEALRNYVRLLCQMHTVMSMVPPGHPWFEHHMTKFQKAAETLKSKLPKAELRTALKLAQTEAKRVLLSHNADVKVFVSVMEALQHNLPQVNDKHV